MGCGGTSLQLNDVEGLAGSIELAVAFSSQTVITTLDFIDGSTGASVSLDLSKPFTINSVDTKAEILSTTGVPGKGVDDAPGLDMQFNPKSQAADHAGKKE